MRKLQGWKSIRLFLLAVLILVTIVLIILGYSVEWTGFNQYTHLPDVERAKTLWDWLDLIVAPLMLALVGILINSAIRQNEREREEKRAQTEQHLAKERMREDTLQSFLDRMEDLLANPNLYDANTGAVLKNIARVRTLTTLRRIDPKRKSILLRFLIDSGFVNTNNGAVLIDLSGADLEQVELHDANLEGAQLKEANLQGAKLDYCNVRGANLINTNFESALLMYCNLEEAKLSTDVPLARAQITNLRGANLSATILKGVDLRDAAFDENTVLPDSTHWTPTAPLYGFTKIDVFDHQ